MQEYLEAIRSRVCSVCIDGIFVSSEQFVRCGLPEDRTCPVEIFLPQVIEVVRSVKSPKIEDYVTVLRQKVCTDCFQTANGMCEVRLQADCALDRYFILVAEAI